MSDSSLFPYGSVTKAFTATLAMQLVSDKDLDLDTPVGEYAPELRTGPAGWAAHVTLRHLLSHTGGLVSEHEPEESRRGPSLRHYALSLRDLEPVCAPGGQLSYSNVGFVVAAYVVERVTGLSWWEALESFVLRPLGTRLPFMTDPRPGRRAARTVRGHTVARGVLRELDPGIDTPLAPAGGLSGTAADLVSFARVHFADAAGRPGAAPLIEPTEAEAMRTPVPGARALGIAEGWGLGLSVYGSGWLGHDGTLSGTTASVRFHPHQGTAIALLTNATSGLNVWGDLASTLRDAGVPVPAGPVPAVSHRWRGDPAELTGRYVNGDMGLTLEVSSHGTLELREDSGFFAAVELFDDFHDPDGAGHVVLRARRLDTDDAPDFGLFVRSSRDGAVTHVQFSGRLAARVPEPR